MLLSMERGSLAPCGLVLLGILWEDVKGATALRYSGGLVLVDGVHNAKVNQQVLVCRCRSKQHHV